MINKKNCRQIGLFVKMHGTKNEFVLRLFDTYSIEDLPDDFLFIDIDGGLVPFKIESIREKNDQDLLIKLSGVEKDEAERYMDAPIYVDNKAISETNDTEFTSYQLIGYKVFDDKLGFIGTIDAINEITNNPLFEITAENGEEYMIPITEDFILGIDDENQHILFDLPDGLIEFDDAEEIREE